MRGTAILLAGVAAAAGVAGPARAGQQERPSIHVEPRTVTYGEAATVTAALVGGAADAGAPVALLERQLPGDGRYREIDRAAADADGRVGFEVRPAANAYYAVRTRAEPVQTSLGLLVSVRPRVTLRVSDRRPRRATVVRLSGTIAPAVGDATVTAQRRARGDWRAVGLDRARTPAGTVAPGRSAYAIRLRVHRSGRYRVTVAATPSLARGASETRRIRVVGPRRRERATGAAPHRIARASPRRPMGSDRP